MQNLPESFWWLSFFMRSPGAAAKEEGKEAQEAQAVPVWQGM